MYIDHSFERAYLKLINEDKDIDINKEQELDTEVDTNQETEKTQNPVKKVCFLTSDPDLIDALNSGFEEVVFFVNAKDEDGKDTVEEVKFKSDSFDSFEISDAEETEECPECCPECGNDPCTCNGDENDSESDEDPDEDLDTDVVNSDDDVVVDCNSTLTEEEIVKECNKLKHRSQYPY